LNLEKFFKDVMALLFPKIYATIDFSKKPQFLDTTMRPMTVKRKGEKMKRCTPVIVFILLFILLAPGSAYGRISLQEREALAALYNKTGGRNWLHQKNWNQAPGSENTWQGITCDAGNTTVLKIELPGNRLQGVLPADLQVFANLTTLDLSNNRLSGEIPRWIESFKNLKKLDLGNNDFSGPIPAWLDNLKNLEELVLEENFACPLSAFPKHWIQNE
jgi:hypothetical protein